MTIITVFIVYCVVAWLISFIIYLMAVATYAKYHYDSDAKSLVNAVRLMKWAPIGIIPFIFGLVVTTVKKARRIHAEARYVADR